MNIEAELIKRIGDSGKKLHTGRSRNDQVATDMRMYLKEQIHYLQHSLNTLQTVLIKLAEKNSAIIMPGYTHLQIAQPVLLAHHLLAYVEMFQRDTERLEDVYKRTDVLPLGSAALAGTAYRIDRKKVAQELGFSSLSENSLEAVSDRDFIIEFQAAAVMIMLHLSRMSEEIILWNTAEFRFIELDDRFTTGSSIMPQKKNPDIPELVRGKTGRTVGNLMALITLIKGLPLAYNRDLQEDKEQLFDSIDTVRDSLQIMSALWITAKFDAARMQQAALQGYSTATDLADYLAKKGLPFRDAHEIAGQIVRYAICQGQNFQEIALTEYQRFSKVISKDIYTAVSLEASINARNIYGGTSRGQVKAALQRAKKKVC
jgi:argininosuccinate lyase